MGSFKKNKTTDMTMDSQKITDILTIFYELVVSEKCDI